MMRRAQTWPSVKWERSLEQRGKREGSNPPEADESGKTLRNGWSVNGEAVGRRLENEKGLTWGHMLTEC